jgi:hypothetical protein
MLDIYWSTVRARGLRVVPLTLGIGLIGLMAFLTLVGRPRHLPAELLAVVYTVVVTSGLIGTDVLSGSVHLLLTRAVTRNSYLAGRYLGGLTVSGVVGLSMYAVPTLIVIIRGDGAGSIGSLAAQALSTLAAVVWASAVVLFFSTILPERGDALGYLGVMVTAISVDRIAHLSSRVPFVLAAQHVKDNLINPLTISDLAGHPALAADLLRWSSNTALLLVGAALVFRHREFSYAAG